MKLLIQTPLLLAFAAGGLHAQDHASTDNLRGNSPDPLDRARCKASQLIGCNVTNPKNESLGCIEEIVLDSGNFVIAYAVVAHGGFLGIGDKFFAVPWRLMDIDQRSAEDKPRVTLSLDLEMLKSAPGFDKGKWPDVADPAWSKQVDVYYRAHGLQARPAGGAAAKGGAVDGGRGVDQAPGSKPFAHRRFSKLIGMNVVDSRHRKLAEIEDLVIDARAATIDGMLLSFGGVLGVGEKLVLVTADVLTLDREKGVFVFQCSTPGLEAMALPEGKVPALNQGAWLVTCREMCAKFRTAEPAGARDGSAAEASAGKSQSGPDSYDLKTVETIKGTILTVGSVSVGYRTDELVRLRVRTSEGRELIVHCAPASYEQQAALELRPGKTVEVVGSPTQYGMQTVMVAGSLAIDGRSVKLRDDQGHANWAKK